MPWRLRDKKTLFTGKRVTLEVQQLRHEETNRDFAREVVKTADAVVIVPVMDDGQIVLIQNYRWAPAQTLIELPAGAIDPGEIPQNAAGRELLEETGFLAQKVQPLGWFYMSPGILTEKMYAFVATGLMQSVARPDLGEEITPMPTPQKQVLKMIRDGEIRDSKTIAAMLMWERFGAGV
jgi:ADP-ribose pyrophosphatase